MSSSHLTEIRFEVDPADCLVLDGYVNATGKCRADVLRMLLGEWSEKKLHESIVVCRVAGVNPAVSEPGRK